MKARDPTWHQSLTATTAATVHTLSAIARRRRHAFLALHLTHLSAPARPLHVAAVYATFHAVHAPLPRGFATVNATFHTGFPTSIATVQPVFTAVETPLDARISAIATTLDAVVPAVPTTIDAYIASIATDVTPVPIPTLAPAGALDIPRPVPVVGLPIGSHREADYRNIIIRYVLDKRHVAPSGCIAQIGATNPPPIGVLTYIAPAVAGHAPVNLHEGSLLQNIYNGKRGGRTRPHVEVGSHDCILRKCDAGAAATAKRPATMGVK